MKLEELHVYNLAMEIAEKIWQIVIGWNHFEKYTVGKQLVKATDSIASNLSEGFGRFSYKENRQFCYYSRGSLFETKTWLNKAHNRNLIEKDLFNKLIDDIDLIGKKLNGYINSIGKTHLNQPMTNDQ